MIHEMLSKRTRNKLVKAIWSGRVHKSSGIDPADFSFDPAERVALRADQALMDWDLYGVPIRGMAPVDYTNLRLSIGDPHDEGVLRMNAFEAAIATNRESLALALWDLRPGDHRRSQLDGLECATSLMFTASVGSAQFLEALAKRCPRMEWEHQVNHLGDSAMDCLKMRGEETVKIVEQALDVADGLYKPRRVAKP